MSRRRADTRRNTLRGYLGRGLTDTARYRFEGDGIAPLDVGRRVTQENVGDLTRERAVRAGVERRGDDVTNIRIRVRQHHSPPI